jgi:hypothetical protein
VYYPFFVRELFLLPCSGAESVERLVWLKGRRAGSCHSVVDRGRKQRGRERRLGIGGVKDFSI